MVNGTRLKIRHAFLKYASKHPAPTRVTIADIAEEAKISIQAIYRKHYSSVEEIIEDIHSSVASDVELILAKHNPDTTHPLTVISEALLPAAYKHRDTLRVMNKTYIAPSWNRFVEECFETWFSPYLEPHLKPVAVSKEFMIDVILKQIRIFVACWLSEKVPQPPEVFEETFMKLLSNSICDILECKVNKGF
ncbi:MAG: TetR/AcrR family transcriptional regulator [Streptococcaceae bacterium]|jgi:AcrR family transcriptional regulator|nr:TetR/AcrR family transcriptional regulator [Streptococcaceae bacterium]